MNETLKAAGHIGAELGAALAENERLRRLLCRAKWKLWTSPTDTLREDIKAALSQQAGPCGGCGNSDESKRCIGCGHRFEKSAEPMCETMQRPKSQCGCPDCGSSLVDWPKAEPAPAQGEQYPPCDFCGVIPDHHPWHGSGMFNGEDSPHIHACNDCRHLLPTRPAQTEQQPVAVPEDFQPLETIRWWISAYTNPENGPSYQGHGMMVQMLCEYEALRIMLSSRAQQRPAAYPHEAMDKLAADRYRVGAAGAGTLHGFAVRAGDGEQELYRGSKSDCEHVALKLAGAFLDGGFTAFERYAAPIAQAAPQPEQIEPNQRTLQWVVDRWHAEVANRPLVNVHRRTLDSTWRQMIRHLGEDDVVLLGPRHDDMLDASGNPLPQYAAALNATQQENSHE